MVERESEQDAGGDAVGSGATRMAATVWRRATPASATCVKASDAGATFRVVITATNADGSTVAVSPVSPVIESFPPVNTELPNVHGTFAVGGELMEFIGRWSSASPSRMTVATQWERCHAPAATASPRHDRHPVRGQAHRRRVDVPVVITATNAYARRWRSRPWVR